MKLKTGFKDALCLRTQVRLSRWQRLKLLLGWRLEVETITQSQVALRGLETECRANVYRPSKATAPAETATRAE